jgi:hypothetical protein
MPTDPVDGIGQANDPAIAPRKNKGRTGGPTMAITCSTDGGGAVPDRRHRPAARRDTSAGRALQCPDAESRPQERAHPGTPFACKQPGSAAPGSRRKAPARSWHARGRRSSPTSSHLDGDRRRRLHLPPWHARCELDLPCAVRLAGDDLGDYAYDEQAERERPEVDDVLESA